MTMAYIIVVNPVILKDAGLDPNMVFIGTCLVAAIATLLMGIYAKYPFAVASGMGINAVLAYGVILGMKLPWTTAMGIIIAEGFFVTVLVLTNLREMVMDAIPKSLKLAIGVAIGLFIAFIGFKDALFMVTTKTQDTILGFGSIGNPVLIVALITLIIIVALMALKIKGSILYGILIGTVIAVALCLIANQMGYAFNAYNIFGGPATIEKLPDGYTTNLPQDVSLSVVGIPNFGGFADYVSQIVTHLPDVLSVSLIGLVFAFMMIDFFDTMGTVVAVGEQGNLMDKKGKLPGINRVLLVDSVSAMIGGFCGASSATTYVESASGVAAGGRTGLTSVTVALLFLVALFFVPLAAIIPAAAAAPALIIVGYLMMRSVKDIPWDKVEDALPAFLTIAAMVFTFSISKGIGFGFISYCIIKTFSGKWREVHPLMWAVSILFALYFIFEAQTI